MFFYTGRILRNQMLMLVSKTFSRPDVTVS